MAYRVLILDDDADFNSLLTDIFEQADYTVVSLLDPVEAVDVFRDNHFDLVVTDHKMPGMTGAEYMQVAKRLKPEVPIIMVSGYLENDTIRELISEGVGGVFLKPLNIFSLLERTAELIEDAKKNDRSAVVKKVDSSELGELPTLGFPFKSYPCKAPVSARFAERLYSLRNFKSTLTMVGGPGAHYKHICEDIRGFYDSDGEHFIYLTPDNFTESDTLSLLVKAQEAGADRVTCVLIGIERMNETQKKLATTLAKGANGFDVDDLNLRSIFCVSGDLDVLFDEEHIDENLYILMGTTETKIPALAECSLDIPVMAQQLVVELAREQKRASVPRFDEASFRILQKQAFPGNYEQLRQVVLNLLEGTKEGDFVPSALQSALDQSFVVPPRVRLEMFLSEQQGNYARAAMVLFNGDKTKVAKFFGTNVDQIDNLLD